MSATLLQCPSCRTDLDDVIGSGAVVCPGCRREFAVQVFPALHRPAPKLDTGSDAFVMGDEAGCFHHPDKKAVVPCDSCGRFLCALCDLEIGGVHWCPACLEKGRAAHRVAAVDSQRTSWPDIALMLSLLPLFFWPMTLLTAPITLYVGIVGWRKPASLTGRKKRVRLVIAMLVALVQIGFWLVLFAAMLGYSLDLLE